MASERRARWSGLWHALVRRRTWVQLGSTVLLNSGLTAYLTKGIPCLALNCHACPLAVTACPVGVIQHSVGLREIPFYVLGVIGLGGALGGRFACGWLCPFGWLQELVHRVPVPKWMVQPRPRGSWWTVAVVSTIYAVVGWRAWAWFTQSPMLLALYLLAGLLVYALLGLSRVFALVGVVGIVAFLAADTWFCKLCPAGTLQAGIPWVLLDPQLRPLIGPLYWLKLGLLVSLLAWAAVTRRPFCRWVCPLGAFWSPLNKWSTLQLAVDQEACIRCNRCQQVCPVDIRIYEGDRTGACIRCMECISECPVSCITSHVVS